MTSKQELTDSQKTAIKSILVTIGTLAILASCFTLWTDGLEPSNFSGVVSGVALLGFGLALDQLRNNKKG